MCDPLTLTKTALSMKALYLSSSLDFAVAKNREAQLLQLWKPSQWRTERWEYSERHTLLGIPDARRLADHHVTESHSKTVETAACIAW